MEYANCAAAVTSLRRRYLTSKTRNTRDAAAPAPFTRLNDDCLENIYYYLNELESVRLALSLNGTRLEYVFEDMICKKLPRHLKLFKMEEFTNTELLHYFRSAGVYVESIEMVSPCNTEMEDFIRNYCINLQRLQLVGGSFSETYEYSHFIKTIINKENITEVEFINCALRDKDMIPLMEMGNLVALGLSHNYYISGRLIVFLRKVKRLSLAKCLSVTENALVDICESLELCFLDIRFIPYNNLNGIVVHCPELEEFKFTVMPNAHIEEIAKLPKLKSLVLAQAARETTTENFCDTLAQHHAHDLLELKILGHSSVVPNHFNAHILRFTKLRTLWLWYLSLSLMNPTYNFPDLEEIDLHCSVRLADKQILSLIRQCRKVKRIGLIGGWSLTRSFLTELISILRVRASGTPLLMLIGGIGHVRTEILQDSVYLNARHLLRLTFQRVITYPGSLYERSVFDIKKK